VKVTPYTHFDNTDQEADNSESQQYVLLHSKSNVC